MGSHAECIVKFGGRISRGKALLESEVLTFRGDFRLSLPFKSLTAVEAENGELRLTFLEGTAIFELGALADKWASRIRHPKSLLDKLGIKLDSQVALVGLRDESFRKQLRERTRHVGTGPPRTELDTILLEVGTKDDLKKLERLQTFLKRDGALWVVWPKGREELKETDIIAAAKDAGLVDTKVVKFSESHSALKLVIPLSRR
jgi:Protein of unknown function (DUF3052)